MSAHCLTVVLFKFLKFCWIRLSLNLLGTFPQYTSSTPVYCQNEYLTSDLCDRRMGTGLILLHFPYASKSFT